MASEAEAQEIRLLRDSTGRIWALELITGMARCSRIKCKRLAGYVVTRRVRSPCRRELLCGNCLNSFMKAIGAKDLPVQEIS